RHDDQASLRNSESISLNHVREKAVRSHTDPESKLPSQVGAWPALHSNPGAGPKIRAKEWSYGLPSAPEFFGLRGIRQNFDHLAAAGQCCMFVLQTGVRQTPHF